MKNEKTLVIGSKGYIGKYFLSKYLQMFPQIESFSYRAEKSKNRLDLSNPNLKLIDDLIDYRYKYALIAAGICNVAYCEKEKEHTHKCNVEGVLKLVEYFCKKNIVPIVFSSDYVFDGKQEYYTEESRLAPLNEYGRQKAELEKKIPIIAKNNYLLIRLSKVFGAVKNKKDFVSQIITDLLEGKSIKAAYDQVFTPIFIEDLFHFVCELQKNNCRGFFNVCGNEKISRYDLSKKIEKKLTINAKLIQRISLEDLQEDFQRPKNTSMNCAKLHSSIDFKATPIDLSIDKIIDNYYNLSPNE